MILDFHTHTFPDKIALRALEGMSAVSHARYFTNGTRQALSASMRESGVDWSLNLPVCTRADQVAKINHTLAEQAEALKAAHIVTFGGMHPACPDPAPQLRFLQENGIRGIKLHPAYQGTALTDPAMLRIIGLASELDLAVLVHAGVDIGFPERNFASVPMILRVLREVRPTRLILAHMGGWQAWDEVERELAGAPVFLDTAYSLGPVPMTVPPETVRWPRNMTPERFARLARAHGTERVLFGTDSPWTDQGESLRLLRETPLTEREKARILWRNGAALLGLTASAEGTEPNHESSEINERMTPFP